MYPAPRALKRGCDLAQLSITTKFDPLSDQVAFPRLSDSEMAQAAFFGERCSFQTGELLVSAVSIHFTAISFFRAEFA